MAVRPDVVVGYVKPRKKAKAAPAKRKAVRRRETLGDVAAGPEVAKLKASIARERKVHPRPKVDTSDVKRGSKPPTIAESLGGIARDARVRPRVQEVKRESVGHALKRELEGHGTIARAAKKAADAIGKSAVIVSTGGGPTIATRVGTGHSPLGKGGSHTATILAPRAVKAPKAVGRTLKDLVNFPAVAIPSAYVPAAAAVEAVRGKPARGKKLLKDLPKTDPVAALVTGHPKRALKLAEEHPGFAAIEAVGVKGTTGRGVTRAQELAGAHPTVRPARKGPEGTDLRQVQSYSRDAGTRAIQKATERRQAKHAAGLRAEGRRTEDPVLLAKANRKDPARMSDAGLRKRVDERVAANEVIRRQNRTRATEEAHRAITGTTTPTGSVRQRVKTTLRNERVREAPTAATTLRAQAITRASVDDLRSYRDELAAAHAGGELRPSEQVANVALRREIDKAIRKNPDPVKLKQAAEDWQAVMAPRQAGLIERGMLAGGQAEKAPLVPYAIRHMEGVTPGEKGPVRVVRSKAVEPKDSAWHASELRRAQANLSHYSAELSKLPADAKIAGHLKHADYLEKTKNIELAQAMIEHHGKSLADTSHQSKETLTEVPVSAAEIEAHMKARGVTRPTYVTQAPGQRGAKNYFVSSGQPPRVTGGTRTGRATAIGTFDAHPDVLVEGVAKAQGLIDAADGFTATVREFAHKPTLGKLKTKREADAQARDLEASTGQRWRPVRVNPFAGRSEQLKALLDKAGGEGGLDESVGAAQPVREALNSAIRGHDGPGPWALMPEAAAAQMAQHLHNLGTGPKAKALQVLGSGFRRTVLATSPTWVTGNVAEATMRSGLARAGPRSFVTGRRAVKTLERIDPQAAQELSARALSGGHYSMADRQHIRRDSSQFQGGTVLEPLARGLGAFWRAPGPKHVAAAWKGWTDLVFRQLNGRLESQFQTAMLGKALRDSPLMDGHTLKMSHEAVEQAARGLRDTNEQAALAREIERMYGKYNAFSPDTRWAISTYTPFIAWTLNAVKFVTDVLPRDHPTVTALIAASEQATEEWRKDKGLDLFIKGALPGFLQGSIPLSGGRHQRAPFRYTPFGAFGDPLATAEGAVLPQFSGVLSAFKGEDWKGAKLRKPNGDPADTFDKAKAAAASFVDATVPIVAQAGRIGKKGAGALNPLAPVAPAKKKARKGTARTAEQDIDAILSDHTQRDIDALLNGVP